VISGSKIVIAGGSGMIGTALAARLRELGAAVCIIGRSARADAQWDGRTLGPWVSEFESAEAVINLAGSSIAVPWTPENRALILSSRTDSTAVIAKAIDACAQPPKIWINASGVGFYGDRGEEELSELSATGTGFLAEVCQRWESSILTAPVPMTRKVVIRLGSVMSAEEGAFPVLKKLAAMFLGGAHGNGRQWFPMVALPDVIGATLHVLSHQISGPVNVVIPNPVRNSDFMAELRTQLRRPFSPPAPAFMLKLAGFAGAPAPELLLEGARVRPDTLLSTGYTFEYPTVQEVIRYSLR